MEGRMNFARVLIVPLIIAIALSLSVCTFSQYKDRSGLKIVAKFPQKTTPSLSGKLTKPSGTDETYVPAFISSIKLTITGESIDPIEMIHSRDPELVEPISNEFGDEIGDLAYGKYNFDIEVKMPSYAFSDGVVTHRSNTDIEIGSGINDSIIADLIPQGELEKDPKDVLSPLPVTNIFYYCHDIFENGIFQFAANVDQAGAYSPVSKISNSSGNLEVVLLKLIAGNSDSWSCRSYGDEFILTSSRFNLPNDVWEFAYKNGDNEFSGPNTIAVTDTLNSSPYMDYAFGKVAVVWIDSLSNVVGKIFDRNLLDTDLAGIQTMDPQISIDGPGYSEPKVKFLAEDRVLVTVAKGASPKKIVKGTVYKLVSTEWTGNPEQLDDLLNGYTSNYSIAKSDIFGLFIPFRSVIDEVLSYGFFDDALKSQAGFLPITLDPLPYVVFPYASTYRKNNYLMAYSYYSSSLYYLAYSLVNPINGTNPTPQYIRNGIAPAISKPRVACNDDGLCVFMWVENNGSSETLYFKRYIF
jgi:hypothetical protein